MAIRPPSMPEEPDDEWPDSADRPERAAHADLPPVTSASWRVERGATILKFAGAAGFAVLPFVLPTGGTSHILGLAVAVGLAIYGLRDVLAPVRLAVDTEGVTIVSGYAGHRWLAWPEIERLRLETRARYASRSGLLEIDAGSSLYFFGRYDLGAQPSEVLDIIIGIRAASRPGR